jgi:hypothetical protein
MPAGAATGIFFRGYSYSYSWVKLRYCQEVKRVEKRAAMLFIISPRAMLSPVNTIRCIREAGETGYERQGSNNPINTPWPPDPVKKNSTLGPTFRGFKFASQLQRRKNIIDMVKVASRMVPEIWSKKSTQNYLVNCNLNARSFYSY